MSEPEKVVPIKKKRKARAQPQLSEADRELAKTIKRLGAAMKGMGDQGGEMLKAAALQIVAVRLAEITALLGSVGYTFQAPVYPQNNGYAQPQLPVHRLTPEEADRQALAIQRAYNGPTCKICGQPSAGKNGRGMDLCGAHLRLDGGTFTADAKVREFIQRAQPASQEEVIEVPQNLIQAAQAAEDDQPQQ